MKLSKERILFFEPAVFFKYKGQDKSYRIRVTRNPPQADNGVILCACTYAPFGDLRVYRNWAEPGNLFFETQEVRANQQSGDIDALYLSLLLAERKNHYFIKEGKLLIPGNPGNPPIYRGDFDRGVAVKHIPLDVLLNCVKGQGMQGQGLGLEI